MTKLQNLLKGLIKENPVLVLVLGPHPPRRWPSPRPSTAAFGMGIAATVVLILSNMAISALRKVIPDTVRIPRHIAVIRGLRDDRRARDGGVYVFELYRVARRVFRR